jgi:hypothetical protein
MYGIPADLDLAFLVGAEVVQVCLGSFDVQVRFHPAASIHINGGDWELKDDRGQIIDRSSDEPAKGRAPFLLHRLLGLRVQATEASPLRWLELKFENGLALRLIDDSVQYESFEIWPLGLIV